jgi:hypothetical protein
MPLTPPPPSWATIKNKPTTVSGFGITDMAAQSVASAVNATNATNATNVANVTTAQVVAANAGASAGAVGSYALARSAPSMSTGQTISGSSITRVDSAGDPISAGLTGTWRCMANSDLNGGYVLKVFLRIS